MRLAHLTAKKDTVEIVTTDGIALQITSIPAEPALPLEKNAKA